MDIRTLFLAQTGALIATAAMLWLARSQADRTNGLQTWTWALTSQGIAYFLLANVGRLPQWLSSVAGNAAGAVSVALFFVAIRQFLGLRVSAPRLAVMVLAVTVVAMLVGTDYAKSTIFNGFVYGVMELLNGLSLWRRTQAEMTRVRRVVALFYLLMGLVLPLRALALIAVGAKLDYLNMPATWQAPIYVFGFLYIIVTNLGFLQLCKMRAEREVRLQAMTDGLTGLANRRALDQAMVQALATAQRSERPFAVVMVDVDHFKSINDRHGHRMGDATLIAFGQRLRTGLRAQDQAFRYGGEEFSVLMPDTDAPAALASAERLRGRVATPSSEAMMGLTASFGIAIWRTDDSADALFGRADRALYRAKRLGRNRSELG